MAADWTSWAEDRAARTISKDRPPIVQHRRTYVVPHQVADSAFPARGTFMPGETDTNLGARVQGWVWGQKMKSGQRTIVITFNEIEGYS